MKVGVAVWGVGGAEWNMEDLVRKMGDGPRTIGGLVCTQGVWSGRRVVQVTRWER